MIHPVTPDRAGKRAMRIEDFPREKSFLKEVKYRIEQLRREEEGTEGKTVEERGGEKTREERQQGVERIG